MKAYHRVCKYLVVVACATLSFSSAVHADPLPGRDRLKFSQRPLDNLTYPVGDGVMGFVDTTFWGHNELSTAYGAPGAAAPGFIYRGVFMADDFADRVDTPVLHVKWWGSYPNFNPDFPVNKFLISFEADVPADPQVPGSFSRPGQPLLNQIVTLGPLAPGSGTYTETPFSPGGPPLFEEVFEYNAELALNKSFPQLKNTVYWLKIVALVDAPGVVVDPSQPIPPFLTQWGWHNRDYTITNPHASTTADGVVPGEHLDFFVPSTPGVGAYHFQDDAVTGHVIVDPVGVVTPGMPPMPLVQQDPLTMQPTNYVNLLDGPGVGAAGLPGIDQYSKDLAFELYTLVPEPAAWVLASIGLTFMAARRQG